jgi:hypothetical protein
MSDEGSFLARWSKRKRDASEQQPEEAQAPGDEAQKEQREDGADEPFDLSALPDLETLNGQSDISVFMNKAVPEALRNAALRKVWALDPSVRDYVGEALDYAWDWNSPGGVPGFGEAIASEETLTFVRNLLAGPTDHENVIGDKAAQIDPSPVSLPGGDEGPQEIDASEASNQISENACLIETSQTIAPQSQSPTPPPQRHRHGGALPS